MRLQTLRQQFIKSLETVYPVTEAERFFTFLAEEYLNLSRVEVVLQAHTDIPENKVSQFEQAKRRLLQFEPIQHILGYTEFCDLQFKVSPQVLIPRPETEELVYWITKEWQKENLEVIDLCTGSGCIAISLMRMLSNPTVYGVDVSKSALEVATYNSKNLDAIVQFIEANVLKDFKANSKFDIIVSNPPYIREAEKKQMQPNVLHYEPDLALFVDDRAPLVFYEHIAKFAMHHLKDDGSVYLEINEYLGKETQQVFLERDFKDVQLKTDIFGKPRFVKATK